MMTHSKISNFSKGSKLDLEFRTPHTPLRGECSILIENQPVLKYSSCTRFKNSCRNAHVPLGRITAYASTGIIVYTINIIEIITKHGQS